MPLSLIQLLSFEFHPACDLGHVHVKCPNSLGVARYQGLPMDRHLTDDMIITLIEEAYRDFGFRSMVNFCAYNEPFLFPDRLLALARRTREVAPDCPLMIVTNGLSLPDDLAPFAIFDYFSVTDYGGEYTPDPRKLDQLLSLIGPPTKHPPRGFWINRYELDIRMGRLGRDRSDRGCLYPFKEVVVDYFGNLKICCFDYQNLAGLGNVLHAGWSGTLPHWLSVVTHVTRPQMPPEAPLGCRRCRMKNFQTLTDLDMGARHRAKVWLKEQDHDHS